MNPRVIAVALGVLGLAWSLTYAGGGSQPSFDRLADADRKVFQERFEREIWPLLVRGGKESCVGCHVANHRSMLKFVGKPRVNFPKLLKAGFFLHNDAANLVAVTETKDRRKIMPPGKRPRWPAADIKLLKQFIADVDKKQKR